MYTTIILSSFAVLSFQYQASPRAKYQMRKDVLKHKRALCHSYCSYISDDLKIVSMFCLYLNYEAPFVSIFAVDFRLSPALLEKEIKLCSRSFQRVKPSLLMQRADVFEGRRQYVCTLVLLAGSYWLLNIFDHDDQPILFSNQRSVIWRETWRSMPKRSACSPSLPVSKTYSAMYSNS